jgi:hypothetical protein
MRWYRCRLAGLRTDAALFALLTGALLAPLAHAQQQLPGTALPGPRLTTLVPAGGKAGTVVEVTFGGTDLEEPQALVFSHPSIKAEPIVPPLPPPPDPKKPPATPPPRPPVTKFKVTIAPNAPPGMHDGRLVNKWGISNPRAFVVGDLPEVLEKEPNNDIPEAQRLDMNTVVHGAIAAPTDVDYFVFAGKRGQRVVVSCLASSIDSRLHAALELYDARGQRLAFNRRYNDRDALLDATLVEDGDYYVRLYEFTHTQGNAEHFYRLSVSTAPWIDAVHPPAIEPGKTAQVTVYGRNLPGGVLDPSAVADGRMLEKVTVSVAAPAEPQARQRLASSGYLPPALSGLSGFEYRIRNAVGVSNPFLITYATAPVVLENDANDKPETPQKVNAPCEIAGRIDKGNDRDWYSFTAKKGEVLNIEVVSERLGAATDIRLVLHNPATKAVITEQDENGDTFSLKFFARTDDPPVYRFTAPADGEYRLMVMSQIGNILHGPRAFYRVRIASDQPDFQLIVMPSDSIRQDSCNLYQNGNENLTILAWRHDGFSAPITLSVEGLPKGVTCPPQTLASGTRLAALVLSTAADAPAWTGEIKVKGAAVINGQTVVREARPGSILWPIQPGQNMPALARLDRGLALAVRDKAPFHLAATLDKPAILQGDKANLTVKLARLWPDFKQPLQAVIMEPIPNLTVNNNQPVTINPDKTEAVLPVQVAAGAEPGTYTIVLRATAQVPFNKNPMDKNRPPVNVVQPSTPVNLTVLPKTVANVALTVPNPNIKAGTQAEVVVKVARLHDYKGELKVQLVVPANLKGISAADAVIAAGKDEVKLVVQVPADAAPGPRNDLVVRATAILNGNVPAVQEAKFNVNVVK